MLTKPKDDLKLMKPIKTLASFIIVLTLIVFQTSCDKGAQFQLVRVVDDIFEHPADIIEHDDHMWVTELMSKSISKTDIGLTTILDVLKDPEDGKDFASPHYLATDNKNLFFSEGWGQHIYSYNSKSSKLTYLPKKPIQLNAPHGVCVSNGWLYIADSLNSKLLRIKLDDPTQIQTFSDVDKKIAYGRQILCRDDGIWIANSYEKRPGLNKGEGSSVLRITDFKSGKATTVMSFAYSNMTGLSIIKNRYLVMALWHANQILIKDLKSDSNLTTPLKLPEKYLGPPYSLYWNQKSKRLFITFIGDIFNNSLNGGVAEYKLN